MLPSSGRLVRPLGLAAALLFGAMAPAQAAPPASQGTAAPFRDVAQADAALPAIRSMASQNIIPPVAPGQFKPGAAFTRGEFATALQRLFALPVPAGAEPFADVKPGDKAHDAVQAAAPFLGRQILCPGCVLKSIYLPDEPVSPAQAAVAVVNVLLDQGKITLLPQDEADAALQGTPDAGVLSPLGRQYVATALKNGLLQADPGQAVAMAPAQTRAGAAVMLDAAQRRFGLAPARR